MVSRNRPGLGDGPAEQDGVPPSGVADQADGIPRSRLQCPSPEALLRLVGSGPAVIAPTAGSGTYRTAPKRKRRTVIGYTTTGDTTPSRPCWARIRIRCMRVRASAANSSRPQGARPGRVSSVVGRGDRLGPGRRRAGEILTNESRRPPAASGSGRRPSSARPGSPSSGY